MFVRAHIYTIAHTQQKHHAVTTTATASFIIILLIRYANGMNNMGAMREGAKKEEDSNRYKTYLTMYPIKF